VGVLFRGWGLINSSTTKVFVSLYMSVEWEL
jgi:hypothetical protein